ncbi:MAG TPA: VCBS repeat-containing protein [Pyrinomonadaceae bacterium]|nr:VCBS repeat-containing protein [Pyrinomonadaceae bacterium]
MTAPMSPSELTAPTKIRCILVVLAVLLSLTLTAAAQTVVFGDGTNYPAGSGPWGIVAGDFNGDGRADIAVSNHGTFSTPGNGVTVLIAKNDGTFNSGVNYPGGLGPTYLVSADFDKDGKLDLATANGNENNISVLLGNGDGTFKAAVSYATPGKAADIATADYNRDGFLDLAMPVGNVIGVMLANGNGGFGPLTSYPAAAGVTTVRHGDVNGDKKLDLVTTSVNAKTVSVLLGNGDGTFQSAINSPTGGNTQPSSVVVGDFNRDGKNDVAVAFLAPPSVNIMLGNGNGSFAAPSYSSGQINTPVDLKAGDFNGDGKIDLVSTGVFIGPHADVFLGKGDGTLNTSAPFGDGPGCIAATVSDFNSDTKPDLAVVANGQVSVVMINATPGLPDDTDYFIHQHYMDFLSREPDISGFDYWTEHIDTCGNSAQCRFERRIGTSAAFLVESEFQQSGYFVYRLFNASFGRRPTYSEFTIDRAKVVGGPNLSANKITLVNNFVQRDQFKTVYPDSLTNTEFVNRLFDSANLIPFAAERQAAIASMDQGATRATVLRGVVDNATLMQREYNPAFVQMQYLGYLRRTEDQRGFQFWLDILNAQPGNFRGMVCSFITSEEYQRRFTNNVTHSNAECGQQ